MTDDDKADITAPPEPTHEATSPPGNPERDEQAVQEGEDKLEQAGGGH
jgi:hypothetical protein